LTRDDYKDPGWFRHVSGTVAYEWTGVAPAAPRASDAGDVDLKAVKARGTADIITDIGTRSIEMKPIPLVTLAALLAIALPAVVLAHAKMTGSNPKDGSTVAAGLSAIEIDFSAPLRISMVHVRDANKREIPLKSELPTSFAPEVKFNVDALGPGSYEVSWTAVAEDGHVMKGQFAFSVRSGEQSEK
jgi:methionine-rich copper-binding protein CopC